MTILRWWRYGFRLALLGLAWVEMSACPVRAAGLPGLPGDIVINEFLALNQSGRVDKLGNRSDWIELYNRTGSSRDLTGWYLTDKSDNLTKWVFPDTTIAANGYLIVVADSSGTPVVDGELHASFALSGGGEYLALVWTNGLTVADQYSPAFPPQSDDVSYGILADRITRGFFAAPTPGASNSTQGCTGIAATPQFSRAGGVFTNAFDLSLSAAAGGIIRYTTDGTVPTETSARYTGPITITHSAQIRARAYETLKAESPVASSAYLMLAQDLRDFSSDLPLLLLDSFGNSVPGTDGTDMADVQAVVIDTSQGEAGGRASATSVPGFAGRGGIKIRGRSSTAYDKKQYKFETWDELNGDRDVELLGMPAESDWVLYGPYDDKTLMRNYLTYRWWEKIGHYSARTRFVEVFLNAGGSAEMSFASHYLGVYVFTEGIKGSEARVGSGEPEFTTDPADITGGYLVEMGNGDSGQFSTSGSGRAVWYEHADPDIDALNAAQREWIRNYIATFETALYATDFADPESGYAKYTDVASQVDYEIFREFTRNFDGGSTYFHVNRGGRLTMGPLWDYNMAIGNCNYSVAGEIPPYRTDGWNRSYTADINGWSPWWLRFDSDPNYRQLFIDRWADLRGSQLSTSNLVGDVATAASLLAEAQVRNFVRWPILGTYVWANPPGYQDRNTYGQEVAWMKDWLSDRCAWIDSQFLPRPVLSRAGGLVPPGSQLTLAGAPGVSLYYTVDGSDPRAAGGGIAPGAVRYAAPLALGENALVRARAYNPAWKDDEGVGLPWSGLAQAIFIVAPPQLGVSEIMYNPRAPTPGTAETNHVASDFEFVEVKNIGEQDADLTGVQFTDGIGFSFSSGSVRTLAAGDYVVAVKNLAAFKLRYPGWAGMKIAGEFSGNLQNAGEKVTLALPVIGQAFAGFTYGDGRGWPVAADGAGHSLVPRPGAAQADGELDYPGNWLASVYIGGSPGAAEPAAPAASLVLNEILAHTDYAVPPYDSNDSIELYNATAAPLTLGAGWYLSDDPENLTKWAIPTTHSLAAHGWRTFDEVHDFHSPITTGFGLNKAAEQVLLSYLPGTGEDRVVDALSFKGQENGVPLVRFPDGAAAWFDGAHTPGASNLLASAGAVIAEVMYHPRPTPAHPENNGNDEFVELYNPTAQAITLMNLVEDVGVWRLAGGISYLFPEATVLPAGGRLAVVPFDPATNSAALSAFLSAYGLTNGQARLFGPFSGQLNNKTDAVRLERPVDPDAVGDDVSWHVVDEVTYADAAPWPAAADGTGRPLTRLPGRNSGDAPASWVAGVSATPGLAPAKIAVTQPAADSGVVAPVALAVAAEVDPHVVVGAVSRIVFAVDGVDAASVSAAPYAASVALDAREGVRRLTARLTDDEGDTTSVAVPIMAYTNVPAFTATANPAVNLTVTDRVGLHATATVLPGMTNPVSFFWSCPGSRSVTLDNPAQADAAAHFTLPGRYELMLTMVYGLLVSNRFVTVYALVTNTVNRVPYKESFESYELGSTLVGIGGWYGAGADAAVITSNRYAEAGPGGYPIPGTHARSLSFSGGVSNLFEQAGALSNVCADLLLTCEPGEDEEPPEEPPETQIAFWVSGERRLLLWHGQLGGTNRWTELTDVTIASNACVRLTVLADYSRSLQGSIGFRIWIDREPVTRPATWFAAAGTNRNYLGGIVLEGEGQVDDLVADPYNSMLYRRITAAAGPHGTVAPAGELYVPVGTSTNISILPDAYYRVGSVWVDGENSGSAATYAFTNVWNEHALSAEFAARLTSSGVPEFWLNGLDPAWTNNFEVHAQADLDGDGQNNEREYVAGTDATNALSVFRLDLGMGNGVSVVSFPTVPVGGFYGLGGVRRYALELAEDLASGNWLGVPGLTDVAGAGQAVTYTNQLNEAGRRFFRGRVWLEP